MGVNWALTQNVLLARLYPQQAVILERQPVAGVEREDSITWRKL